MINERLVIIQEPKGPRKRIVWFVGNETCAVFYSQHKEKKLDFLDSAMKLHETKEDAVRVSLRWMRERMGDSSQKEKGAAIVDIMGTVFFPYIKDGVKIVEAGGQYESRPAFDNAALFTAERCSMHIVDKGPANVFQGGAVFKLFPNLDELKEQTGNPRVRKLRSSSMQDHAWLSRYHPFTERQLLDFRRQYGPIIVKQEKDEDGEKVYHYSPALPVYGPYMEQYDKSEKVLV